MMSYVGADDMFENFTAHTCQGDWPMIFRQVTVSFFVDWGNVIYHQIYTHPHELIMHLKLIFTELCNRLVLKYLISPNQMT